MKKLLTILITILMLFVIAGCSTNPGNANFIDKIETSAKYKEVGDDAYEGMLDYEVYYRYNKIYGDEYIYTTNETNMTIMWLEANYQCYDASGNVIYEDVAIANHNNHIEPGAEVYLKCDIPNRYADEIAEVKVSNFTFSETDSKTYHKYIDYNVELIQDDNEPDYSTFKVTITNSADKPLNVHIGVYGFKEGKISETKTLTFLDVEAGKTITEEPKLRAIKTSEVDEIKYNLDVTD